MGVAAAIIEFAAHEKVLTRKRFCALKERAPSATELERAIAAIPSDAIGERICKRFPRFADCVSRLPSRRKSAPSARKFLHSWRGPHISDVSHSVRSAFFNNRGELCITCHEHHVRQSRMGGESRHSPAVVGDASIVVKRAKHLQERHCVAPRPLRRGSEPKEGHRSSPLPRVPPKAP